MKYRSISRGQEVLVLGQDRMRIGPWHGSATTAQLTPMSLGAVLTHAAVAQALEVLADQGYVEVITSAVGPAEQRALERHGFDVRRRLHLLERRLDHIERPTPGMVRRARRADRPAVLEVDAAAFSEFWQLDDLGLQDALSATPSSRFRVTTGDPIAGYAIAGRGGDTGYLQRLAVSPNHQRSGAGTALVLDALSWLRRRGANTALVNTQTDNAAALALYEHLGFARQADGLAVMAATLT